MKHISIIGEKATVNNEKKPKPLETNFDEEFPPTPAKRKVIVAQRPNSFIYNLKVQL